MRGARPDDAPLSGARIKEHFRTRTKKSKNFARHLRKEATEAEKQLWRLLRDRRFNEFKFRRQHPMRAYLVDFYCPSAHLAIELDGGGHGYPGQKIRDDARDNYLAANSIKVMRFWNHQIMDDLDSVRMTIWYELMERSGRVQEIAAYIRLKKP